MSVVRAAKAGTGANQLARRKEAELRLWRREKSLWEHRLRVDLPAALSRRQAGAPHYKAIESFAQWYDKTYQNTHAPQAEALDQATRSLAQTNPGWEEKCPGLWRLARTVHRLQATSSEVPIANSGGRTVGTLAAELTNLTGLDDGLRGWVEEVERRTFGDEQAGRQVAKFRSNAELADYLAAGAAQRYAATYQRMLADYPVSPALRSYFDEDARMEAWSSVAQAYCLYWNAEVQPITFEFSRFWTDMYVGLGLQKQSGSDDDARQVLTELNDLQQMQLNALAAAQ